MPSLSTNSSVHHINQLQLDLSIIVRFSYTMYGSKWKQSNQGQQYQQQHSPSHPLLKYHKRHQTRIVESCRPRLAACLAQKLQRTQIAAHALIAVPKQHKIPRRAHLAIRSSLSIRVVQRAVGKSRINTSLSAVRVVTWRTHITRDRILAFQATSSACHALSHLIVIVVCELTGLASCWVGTHPAIVLAAIVTALFSETIQIEASRALLASEGIRTYFAVAVAGRIGTDRTVAVFDYEISPKAFRAVRGISTLQTVWNQSVAEYAF